MRTALHLQFHSLCTPRIGKNYSATGIALIYFNYFSWRSKRIASYIFMYILFLLRGHRVRYILNTIRRSAEPFDSFAHNARRLELQRRPEAREYLNEALAYVGEGVIHHACLVPKAIVFTFRLHASWTHRHIYISVYILEKTQLLLSK